MYTQFTADVPLNAIEATFSAGAGTLILIAPFSLGAPTRHFAVRAWARITYLPCDLLPGVPPMVVGKVG